MHTLQFAIFQLGGIEMWYDDDAIMSPVYDYKVKMEEEVPVGPNPFREDLDRFQRKFGGGADEQENEEIGLSSRQIKDSLMPTFYIFDKVLTKKWLGVTWVGNKGKAGGAQGYVIDNLKDDQWPILSYTRKHGRLWGAGTLDQLLKLLTKDHGIYEILIPDVPPKVHFNIDHSDASWDEIRSTITGYFPNAIMNISGRLGTDMSLHITLENYWAPNLEGLEAVKVIALRNREKGSDASIYTKNRNMKCINQAKPNGPVQKYLEGNTNTVSHLILHGIDKINSTDITGMKFNPPIELVEKNDDLTTQERELLIDVLAIPQQNLVVPGDFDLMTATPLDKLTKLPNPPKFSHGWPGHDIIWQVMRWCKQVGITFEQFWSWNRGKNNSVERYKRYLRLWENCKYPVSHKAMDILLERIYPNIRETQATKRLREQFDVPVHKTVEGQFLSADDISEKTKFTLLKPSMGGNKTGSTVSYLVKNAEGSSVLWIAPRITLAQNTLQRLKEEGMHFVNYKDFSRKQKLAGELNKQNYLICSIQSLHYLDKNFDYIVADEWDTIASTFAKDCKTHGDNLIRNWTIWVNQLQKAKKVIIMDALTTKLTTKFLDAICRHAPPPPDILLGNMVIKKKKVEHRSSLYEIVDTTLRPPPRTFMEYNCFNSWLWNIFDELGQGKKLYMFTPFRSGKKGVEYITKAIMEHFGWNEGTEVLSYYAEKKEEKKKLAEVEEVWAKDCVRCIVTNGTISVGVDFNKPDVFDRIHAFYTPQTPPETSSKHCIVCVTR
ncbi:hypothetical protein HK104_004450 [Borealophlyctis nickersoniae]|nr:hypothetical protein HK104_004450 [Borealophlyctis nickersoniae]